MKLSEKEMLLEQMKKDPSILFERLEFEDGYISDCDYRFEDFFEDDDIKLEALKDAIDISEFTDCSKILCDREKALKLIETNPDIVSITSDYKDDMDFAKKLFEMHPYRGDLIVFFSDKVKANTEVSKLILQNASNKVAILIYYPENLRYNNRFLAECGIKKDEINDIILELCQYEEYILEDEEGVYAIQFNDPEYCKPEDAWRPGPEGGFEIIRDTKVKSFAKKLDVNVKGAWLDSTVRANKEYSDGMIYCSRYYKHLPSWRRYLVYSKDESPEVNESLLAGYTFAAGIFSSDREQFARYHESDLIKCLGGIDNYVDWYIDWCHLETKDEKSITPREQVKAEIIERQEAKKGTYTVEQIGENVPAQGAMDRVMEETTAAAILEKEARKYSDNPNSNPGGDNR